MGCLPLYPVQTTWRIWRAATPCLCQDLLHTGSLYSLWKVRWRSRHLCTALSRPCWRSHAGVGGSWEVISIIDGMILHHLCTRWPRGGRNLGPPPCVLLPVPCCSAPALVPSLSSLCYNLPYVSLLAARGALLLRDPAFQAAACGSLQADLPPPPPPPPPPVASTHPNLPPPAQPLCSARGTPL